jgi:hypothetical protein
VRFIWILGLCLATAGCGERTATVAGTVTLDGRPLEMGPAQRGTVVFYPAGGGALATGTIASDATYRLSTGSSTRVAAGDYLVSVRVVEVVPASDEHAEPSGRPVTPAIYGDANTSGFKFAITPGENKCDLALRSDAGPLTAPTAEDAEPPAESDEIAEPSGEGAPTDAESSPSVGRPSDGQEQQ